MSSTYRNGKRSKRSFSSLALFFLLVALSSSGLFLSSSNFANAASAIACPATDGGAGDGDATVDGVITINANTTWNTTGYTAVGDYWNCAGLDVHVTNNKTLTFEGDTTNGYYPFLKADNVTIDSGSSISATGKGCSSITSSDGFGPDFSNVCTVSTAGYTPESNYGGGAAYGGAGGYGKKSSFWDPGGVSYGGSVWPVLFGSSGSGTSTTVGGSGGGVVYIEASSTITLNGSIVADGNRGTVQSGTAVSSGGSGGSILLVADTVAGTTGSLSAAGSAGRNNGAGEITGGAGGGRVAVHANTASAQFSTFAASTVSPGGVGGGGSTAEDGADGTYELNPTKTPSIIRARSYDNTSSNSQIDTVVLEFNQPMDSSTIATSDFTTSDARTITGVTVDTRTVTLTLTEAGTADLDSSFSVNVVSSVSGLSGGSVTSLTAGVLAPSCSYVDGTQADHDRTIDQTFTISRESVTWTPVDSDGEVCTGQNLTVTNGTTLTFGGDSTNGYYTSYSGGDITVSSTSSISADEQGCSGYDAAGLGVGSGPGVNNACAYDGSGGGSGSSSLANVGAGGGSHGGAGAAGDVGATTYAAGSTHGTENNPLSFGATGGHAGGTATYYGGAGGGIIHVVSTGTFILDGSLSANGGAGLIPSGNQRSGGGAGGSINITTQTLESTTNTCDVSADGGASGGDGAENAGSGGGGRVSFRVGTVDAGMTCYTSLAASSTSPGGVSTYDAAYNGSVGTLYKGGLTSVPDTPTNSSPSDSATGVSRTPTLSSSAYSGSDTHLNSTWQVDNNSDFSSPEWTAVEDTSNLTSIVLNNSNGVFANDLSSYAQLGSDTYYFRVLHANVTGESDYSTATSFTTQNSAPTVASLTGSQRSDGSGIIDFGFTLDDVDDDENIKAKIELSTDGGTTWTDPTLTEALGPPSVTNASAYQVESVDVSGGAQVISSSFPASNFTGLDGSILYRVTANDQTLDSTAVNSSSILVDLVAPTEAVSFANSGLSATSASFSWTASTETNFANYSVWYGTNQSHVESQSGTALEWDNVDDVNLATISTATTSVTGLTANTTYYALICASDSLGSTTCGTTAISFVTSNPPVVSSYSAAQTDDASGDVSVAFTVSDLDGGTVDLKLEYSIDGVTWLDPSLSNNVLVDNLEAYQVQNVDLSVSSQDITLTWDAATDLSALTDDDTVYLRITPTDGTNLGTIEGAATAFTVDLVAPVAPSGLTSSTETSASIDFTWTAGAESHFSNYIIWYGTSQSNVEAKSSSSWTTSDQANLNTRTTETTSITGLNEATTYYFLLCAHDDYGYESCSSTYSATTGSKPTVASITASEKTDGTGTLDVSAVFNDVDGDTLKAKVELSVDGGTTWTTTTLMTADSATTASTGDVAVATSGTYRLGTASNYIDTSGGVNTVSFDIPAINFADVDIRDALIRITPNDLGSDGEALTSSSFTVDVVDPGVPANFAHDGGVPGVMFLSWDITTESNFSHYEIWYGKDQTKVDDQTTSGLNPATEFDNDPDDSDLGEIATDSVVINGLDEGATYYAKLCAVDLYANTNCTSSITITEDALSIVQSVETKLPKSKRDQQHMNICVPIEDADNPSQLQLGADYSTDGGGTWSLMTIVSSSVSVTSGSTPSFLNGANYQIGQAGAYIPMSTGSNTVCFDWDYGDDLGVDVDGSVTFNFRPYDGTNIGTYVPSGGGIKSPQASFTASCSGLVCSFDASASLARAGSLSSYEWNFGDTNTGTGSTGNNTFAAAGLYNVTLTVTNSYGKTHSYSRSVNPQSSGDPLTTNASPKALFTYDCENLVCSFTDASSDSDGTISSYSWNFGGDGTATTASPNFTFSEAGTFNVYLTVTDDDSATNRTKEEVTVKVTETPSTPDPSYAPVASIAEPVCDGLACDFDATGSSDPDGSIASYTWFFGDQRGGATTSTPSHSYASAGTYVVRLYVTDDDGLEDRDTVFITVSSEGGVVVTNEDPNVSFTYTSDGLSFTFDGSASSDSDGTISSYVWSFGDGTTDSVSGATATHTYSQAGLYNVTLTVTDDDGASGIARQQLEPMDDSSGGGVVFNLDETAPTGLSALTSSANTSQTLTMDWSEVTEDNFYRYEIWVGTNLTKVNNRDITGEDGAFRWDEGYDVDMLTQSDADSIVSGLSENTTYYLKIWAKDSYENESTLSAVSYKTNARPVAATGSESKATDGTGKLTFQAAFDDIDDVDTLKAEYYYNVGLGWQAMTLLEVASVDAGSPAISGNQVGTDSGFIPTSSGANDLAVIWDSKTDLPTADLSTLKIRVIPHDAIEYGDALVLEDLILDNVAPVGLGSGSATILAASRVLSRLNAPVLELPGASATVTWSPVTDESSWSGIASYWVTYGTSADALNLTWDSTNDPNLTTMSTSSTVITGLETNTTYYFKVYTQDAFGNQTSTDVFSASSSSGSSGSGSSGSSSGGSSAGSYDFTVAESEEFEFDYELPDHWSADYIETFIHLDTVWSELEDDELTMNFVLNLLEDPDQEIRREESVLLLSLISDTLPNSNFRPDDSDRFRDLLSSHDYYNLILFNEEEGNIDGYPDNSFKPKSFTQRIEALKMIADFLSKDLSEEGRSELVKFPDVSSSEWYSSYLNYAIRMEIVEGYQDGEFKPIQKVTMAEMLKMSLLMSEI